jgi:mono/diheme cytochrome c family protein
MIRTCFALLVLLGGAAAAHGADAPSAADTAAGGKLFVADGCYECHGYAGQGARSSGPALARTQLPLEAFMMQLRSPSNEMPPYTSGVLGTEAAAEIYAYLQSLPPPREATQIPLLSK